MVRNECQRTLHMQTTPPRPGFPHDYYLHILSIMRSFHPIQVPFLLFLNIHSISAKLDLGTQLAYPTLSDLTSVFASTDGPIPQEDYVGNTDSKECDSVNSQRRIRARAYNNDDPSTLLCPYEPGAAVLPQPNFKQPQDPSQQQLDGTKEIPNNPDPNSRPGNEKQKWWEIFLNPIEDLVRPWRQDHNDNRKAPHMSDALCTEHNRRVPVCSAEIPHLSGPGELVIEYCRFRAFPSLYYPLLPPMTCLFLLDLSVSTYNKPS